MMRCVLSTFFCLLLALPAGAQQGRGLEEVVVRMPSGEVQKLYDTSWAALIGVNEYVHWPRLSYAVRDVERMQQMLSEKLGFPADHIFTLTDREVTLENMKVLLGRTLRERAGPNDRVLIFYAGHGGTTQMAAGGDLGFLVPFDASMAESDYVVECLSMREIRTFAGLIEARHILFLVDACYSGLAVEASYSAEAVRPFDFRFARSPVRQVITGGRAGERVFESDEWGHSALAWQFFQGMDSGLADMDGDALVTGTERAAYLKPRVSRISGNRQTPQFRPWGGEGEFVFVLDPAERLRREAERHRQAAAAYGDSASDVDMEIEALRRKIRQEEARIAREQAAREEQAAYERATRAGTVEALQGFLERYPGGGYAGTVRDRIAQIRLEAERAAFEEAKRARTADAMSGFLTRYPDSRYAREARGLIADIREEEAEQARQAAERARLEKEKRDQEKAELERRLRELQSGSAGVLPTAAEGNMVLIPAGEFRMGSNDGDNDEKPVHTVYVDGFWMDTHEVTVAQFRQFKPGYSPSQYSSCDNCPARGVSWDEAAAYCASLGKRLPTEAEWEKACRGPQGYEYSWGNRADQSKGRFNLKWEDGAARVGSYEANGYGLYDMSGNVWEWCADWYDKGYYGKSPS